MYTSLNDYAAGFFTEQGQADASELLKAMQAGQITGRDTTNQNLGFEPLKVESLDTVLKTLTFRAKDLKIWNAIPKITAYNTVEEYIQLVSYGNRTGGFYAEGELSDVEDSVYNRRAAIVKYLQVTGEVTLQSQMVRSIADSLLKETQNKVMWIQERANTFMTKGNSNIVSEEWDGLYSLHQSVGTGAGQLYNTLDEYFNSSNVVIDMRGKSIKQNDVEKGAVLVDANYGNVDTLFAPTQVISALSQDYYLQQRILLNSGNSSAYTGSAGSVIKSISTTIGDVSLAADKFLATDPGRKLTDGPTSLKAPAVIFPDGTTPLAVVANDSSSRYTASEAGNVFYAVAAKNRYGLSAIIQVGSTAAIAASTSVNLKFIASTGSFAATGFVIYRTLVTTASTGTNEIFYPIFEVSLTQLATGYDGAGAGVVRDRGRFLPNTDQAFLGEMVDDVLAFKQLAPISKFDLANISLSKRFITFLFGTPQLSSPKKIVRFINCARTLV